MGVREGWGKLGDSVWYKYTTMCKIAGGNLLYSTGSSAPCSVVQQKLTQCCKAIISQFFFKVAKMFSLCFAPYITLLLFMCMDISMCRLQSHVDSLLDSRHKYVMIQMFHSM